MTEISSRARRGAAALVLIVSGCTSNSNLPPTGLPVTGSWGGEHIRLALSPAGGQIEYDCGRGVISEAVRPDAKGAFDVRGYNFRGHGGPVRIDEPIDSASVRYVGTIRDNVMKLDVLLGGSAMGSYVLAKGGEARVFRCL